MDKKYVVAYGKTLSTQKGIVDAGEPVDLGHFLDQAHLDELLEKGFVQEAAEYKKIKHYQGKIIPSPKPDVVPEENPPTPEPIPELKLGGARKAKKA